MTKSFSKMAILLSIFFIYSANTNAIEYSYKNISARYKVKALSTEQIVIAKIQGECLVGLKELNFKKKEKFDPVSEWSNYRSTALLRQYSPCEVLVMLEVAQEKLRKAK